MSNWAAPAVTTDAYASVLDKIKVRAEELAVNLDPAVVTITNPIVNSIRWNSALGKDEIYNGSSWVDKASTYAINISGTASNVTGIVAVAKGGTSFSSYTIGDLLTASAVGVLSKLAAVATGNVLRSAGVGVMPTWGKVDQTAHITGLTPVANGGSGRGTHVAYSVICGGTTTTGAQQSVASVGTAGQALVSQGPGALPQFQTLDFSGATNLKWLGASYTVSTAAPSGGVDGDFWFEREA